MAAHDISAGNGAAFVGDPERVNSASVIPFTPRQARLHTDRTYASLEHAYDAVMTAYDRQAWKVCPRYEDPSIEGYDSWHDYLWAEFDGLRILKLDDDEQAEAMVRACREQGMSFRQIAKCLGMSVGRAHKLAPEYEEGTTVGDDGREYAKSTGKRPKLTAVPDLPPDDTDTADEDDETAHGRLRLIERVVVFVKSCGEAGCTSADVKKAFPGKGHQRISAALSRAHHSKRIRYVPPDKRGQFGRYCDTEDGS